MLTTVPLAYVKTGTKDLLVWDLVVIMRVIGSCRDFCVITHSRYNNTQRQLLVMSPQGAQTG